MSLYKKSFVYLNEIAAAADHADRFLLPIHYMQAKNEIMQSASRVRILQMAAWYNTVSCDNESASEEFMESYVDSLKDVSFCAIVARCYTKEHFVTSERLLMNACSNIQRLVLELRDERMPADPREADLVGLTEIFTKRDKIFDSFMMATKRMIANERCESMEEAKFQPSLAAAAQARADQYIFERTSGSPHPFS